MTTRALLYWVALIAGAELLARGHLADQPGRFHAGAWLLCAAWVASAWRWRRTRLAAVAFAGLALLSAGLSLHSLVEPPGSAGPDPLAAFWRDHVADRTTLLQPPRERREDAVRVFGASVPLDAQGFRAAPPPEPGSFRIVALGDANTFGVTRSGDEQPWPALLERAIEERFRCAAPVRVINAGVPGRRFAGQIESLERDVLPLDPDVLVVYPNPEQLELLAREVPGLVVPAAVPTPPRASALLRRIERWLREREMRAAFAQARATPIESVELRPLPLAGGYRRLMIDSRARGTDVVLAPLALALPPDASEAEIRRHEAIEPRTRQLLVARALHERLITAIGATYRAARVELEPGPRAGDAEAFLDLWLLSQRGREQLAEAVLRALRPRLERAPRPGCVPRAPDAAQPSPRDGGN